MIRVTHSKGVSLKYVYTLWLDTCLPFQKENIHLIGSINNGSM